MITTIVNWLPSAMIFGGAVLAAVGGFWLNARQSRESNQSAQTTRRILDSVQDSAARLGNIDLQRQVVAARTEALTARQSEANAAQLAQKLPNLVQQFQQLQQSREAQGRIVGTDFKLKWQPLLNYIVDRFDGNVADLRKGGVDIPILAQPPLDIVSDSGQPRSSDIRVSQIGNYRLLIRVRPFSILPAKNTSRDANIYLGLQRLDVSDQTTFFQIIITPNEASVVIEGISQTFPVAEGASIPPALTKRIDETILQSMREYLMQAKGAPPPSGSR